MTVHDVEFVEESAAEWRKSKQSQVALLTELLAEVKKTNELLETAMKAAPFLKFLKKA